jgi:hypothetical protein
MVEVFYSIFSKGKLIFANNTLYRTKENALKELNNLREELSTQPNIKILYSDNNTLKFIDIPNNPNETEEFHTFTITEVKGGGD